MKKCYSAEDDKDQNIASLFSVTAKCAAKLLSVMAQVQDSVSESKSGPEEAAPGESVECQPQGAQSQESYQVEQTQLSSEQLEKSGEDDVRPP